MGKRVDWTVIRYKSCETRMECLRCGRTAPLSFPMEMDQLVALINLFNDKHKDCEQISKS